MNKIFIIIGLIVISNYAIAQKKSFISSESWKNNIIVNDWSTWDKSLWFDMDLDGNADKITFQTPNSNSFFFKIFIYTGNKCSKTININSIVRDDALNKFITDSLLNTGLKIFGAGRIAITDYNNDSIPDIIFGINKQEDQANIYPYPAYQLILLSKGILDYELKVMPIWFRSGDQDVYGDFNGDGKTDFFTGTAVHSDDYYPNIQNSTQIVGNIDLNNNKFNFQTIGDGSFQGVANINDFDNNGISDILIGEMDNGFDVVAGPNPGAKHYPGNGPYIYMNFRNGIATNKILLQDTAFKNKWQTNKRFDMTESFAFADLNNDGFLDILLTKIHDDYNYFSDGKIDSLRGERLFQVFINKNGVFTDSTNLYFPNNTNYIKVPHLNPGDFIPSQGKLIDVDGDGKVDYVFPTYKFYYKNINNKFVLQTNESGFNFPSQKYKSSIDTCKIEKPIFNTLRKSFPTGDSLNLSIVNNNKGDTLKWYYGTKSDLTNVSNKTFSDSTLVYVTKSDSTNCIISSDTIKITTYPKLQITTKLRAFKFNLNTYKDAAPNIFLKMHQTITQTVLYSVNGVEHIVTIPVDSVPNAPIHFINKTGNWEVEKFYPNFKMDGARNYSFIDTLGNFAYANTGSEVPRPWPLGDLVVVNTINDTLKWTKVDSVKAFYHSVGTGDLNGDGLADVVGLHMQSNYWSDNLHPFLQNKNGTYSEGRNVISSDVGAHRNSSGAVLVADVLGDSKPEIIRGSYGFTGANGETRYAFEILGYDKQTNQYIKVYEPKKLGVFTDIVNGGQGATSIKSADFDHNGFQDLVICSEGNLPNSNTKGASMIQIWLNNGKGEFIPDQYIINNADDSLNIREFEVADVDNDGWLDIVMHGIGGPLYRQPVLSSKYGYYFQINNLIWKNNSGVFDIIPNQLNVYDPSNIELIGNSNFLKGFMVNGKLKFIGFECADAINPTKLYEITVNFCNNLIKPAFSSSKYSFCTGDSLKLTVSNINKGDTLKWYYGSKSDLTNLSNKTFTDSTKLFVTRTDSLGCVISSDTISITKNALPALPTVKDTVFCQNINASTLLATGTSGNTITWYGTNATGGTGNASAVVASTTDTTTKSYYVSQINNTTSCESPRAKITVKINPAPASPSVKDTAYCNNISADTLKATSLTGHSLNWYGTSATGGTGSVLGSKPTTTTVGSFSYYVSQKNNTTGCEGARAKIGVTINPLPIAPIVRDTNYCNNASADTIRLNTSTGATLLWYGTNATGGASSTTAIKPGTATVGAANYYLSQIITATGCEGPRSKVVVTTKPIPSAPTLSRDTANFLLSGAAGTTWYKDGSAITDTTQKYKPATPGSYTAKTTTNGCTSVMSAAYYYLVTDIINLSKDEFIKLAPNPFINQLNFDFIVKGYQRLNIEVFDIATGTKVANQQNIIAGTQIQLGQLARGTYIIRVTSNDNKIAHQFKMVKL